VQAPSGTQALQRAIGLLKQFSTDRPNQTLRELGSALGLTKSTTHRLHGALASQGLIASDETVNTFHLGAWLIALGSPARCAGGSVAVVSAPPIRTNSGHRSRRARSAVRCSVRMAPTMLPSYGTRVPQIAQVQWRRACKSLYHAATADCSRLRRCTVRSLGVSCSCALVSRLVPSSND